MWHADGFPTHRGDGVVGPLRNVGTDIALGYGGHTRYFDLSIPATEKVRDVIRTSLP